MTHHRSPFSTQVDADILQRVRAAVHGLQQEDPSVSLASFTTDALAAHCTTIENQHHHGDPWPFVPPAMRPGPRPATPPNIPPE